MADSTEEDTIKTAKTAALSTVATALSVVTGLVSVPLIALVLSQEDLGIASTFLANRNVLAVIITLAATSYVNKAMIEFAGERVNYFFTIACYAITMVAGLFLACLPFKTVIMDLLAMDDFLFYWLSFSLLAYIFFDIGSHYCTFQNKTKTVFFITLFNGTFGPLLSVLFAYLMPTSKAIGRVLGLDLPYACVAIVFLAWIFLFHRHKRLEFSFLKRTLLFTVPLIPHLLSQMLLTQSDLIMITSFLGPTDSGLYSMGHTISFLAFTAMAQIMAAWSPWVYRRLSEDNLRAIRHNFKYILSVCVFLSTGLLMIAPEVVSLLLPASYQPINGIIPPLVMAMFFQSCYLFFFDLLYFHRKSVQIAIASVVSAGLNILLNFLWIPSFGFYAACYSTLISYFALFALCFAFSNRYRISQTYNLKLLGASIGIMALFVGIALTFTDSWFIRYASFAALLVCLVLLNRHMIAGVLDRLAKRKS